MRALIELLNAIVAIINRALAKREQKQHEETVNELQRNPGEFVARHFGSVPDKPADSVTDETDTKRNSPG